MSASPFHVKFNLEDYADILPPIPDDDSDIINSEIDDIYEQYWQVPDFPNIITQEFIFREVQRIKHGVWMLNKGVLMWIPGDYYQFLVYGNANGDPPQFRLKRLKNIYLKIRVRKNPRFVGTFTIKNRQDGETTFAMSDSLWEINSGELNNGMIGIQSKTRDDAKLPCWFNLKMQWNGYPRFLKDELYSHFVSGNNIEEKLEFSEPPDPNDPKDKGKSIIIKYGPSTHNAFDGKNNVRKMVCDEIIKWVECSWALTFTNYMKFMMPGKVRKGLFDIFSSPSDTNGRHNNEGYQFWKDSDPDELTDTGATRSRVLRIYSNPLEGIEGFYDKYGDADPQEILEHIHRERNNKPKDQVMAEVRGFPLPIIGTDKANEDEMFGSADSNSIWINKTGMSNRRISILKQKTKLVQYCNIEWPGNVPDSGEPILRIADTNQFNDETARFCISHDPKNKIELSDFNKPPHPGLIERVIGTDPFNLRYGTKNQVTGSLGAAICWQFRDFDAKNNLEYPTLSYLARPWHQSIYMEDMILACIYMRAMMHYENKNTDLEKYFEDRGKIAWMLVDENAKVIETPDGKKVKRGAAPDGRAANTFMNNGIGYINGVSNLPLTPEQPYFLDLFNHEEILADALDFNKADTVKNHFTMAWIQALIGRNKILFKKIRKKDTKNNMMLQYLLET